MVKDSLMGLMGVAPTTGKLPIPMGTTVGGVGRAERGYKAEGPVA